MRFTPTRVQPLDDSPAPGVIPGAVHVHHEPEHAARPADRSERPAPAHRRAVPLHRRFRAGHRP